MADRIEHCNRSNSNPSRASGVKEYKVTDHLGSTRVVMSPTWTTSADYEPFGEAVTGLSPTQQRTMYIGKEVDVESAIGDFGYRRYDEGDGRFLSTDPLWESVPGVSPYVYVENDPLNLIDPTGLSGSSPITYEGPDPSLSGLTEDRLNRQRDVDARQLRGPALSNDVQGPIGGNQRGWNAYVDAPSGDHGSGPSGLSAATGGSGIFELGYRTRPSGRGGPRRGGTSGGGTKPPVRAPLPPGWTPRQWINRLVKTMNVRHNAGRGRTFERKVNTALSILQRPNREFIGTVAGKPITTRPDLINRTGSGGVTEIGDIKDVVNLSYTSQLQAQRSVAENLGVPFNLIVSPRTRTISQTLQTAVYSQGGTIQVYNPANSTFSTWTGK